MWKRSLLRWDSNTDVLLRRGSEKILKSMDCELQSKLDHLTDAELQGQDYLRVIFFVMDVLAGAKEESEKRRCVRAALYEVQEVRGNLGPILPQERHSSQQQPAS